jgi:hypothetical protein
MGLRDAIKRLMGGGSGTPGKGEPPSRGKRSISQQVASIRGQNEFREFTPTWEQEANDPTVSAPGPLPADNVTYTAGESPLDITFAMEQHHLVFTVDKQHVHRIAFIGVQAIKLRDGKLDIALHVPLPVPLRGELRAIRALAASVFDPIAVGRWTWLSAKHSRSFADCPYCFKSAVDIEPSDSGSPQPVREGKPYATAHCRSCLRNFEYDYAEGEFLQVDSPNARI